MENVSLGDLGNVSTSPLPLSPLPLIPSPQLPSQTPLAPLPELCLTWQTLLSGSHHQPTHWMIMPQPTESLTPLAPIPPTHANFPTPDSDGRTDAAGTPALPAFIPMASPIFTWGDLDAETFTQRLNLAYSTVIHWRRNIFAIPTGNAGTAFVRELSRLFRAYATGSALESVALRAAMTICVLLLQKPSRLSKSKDHVACLERRMGPWRAGDLHELLQEGLTIQRRLINSKRKPCSEIEKIRRVFVKEMSKGNTKAALRSLSKDNRGSVLRLSDIVSSPEGAHASVLDTLKAKHPPGGSPTEDSIVNGAHNPPAVHPVIFDSIQGATIHSAALRTSGAAGPSGIDARGWRRLCSSYKSASDDLCHSLALLTRRLCTVFVDPEGLAPLMSCRLIALDKNPGVRPIGICEVVRRIIAKAILSVTSGDIQDAAGSLQLCAGQRSGTEAAVHAMNTVFKDEDCEAVLLVDASNAFNALNRQVALRNIGPFAHPLLPLSLTHIAMMRSSLWTDPPYSPKRAPHKETLWLCQCMPSPYSPSSRR